MEHHFRDLKKRGLRLSKLTVADGHLGIWSALTEVKPEGREQRCWNHKLTNVLDRFPKNKRAQAAEYLHSLPYAFSTRRNVGICAIVHRPVCKGLSQSNRDTVQRLGADGNLLFVSKKKLGAYPDNQHRGVSVQLSAVADGLSQVIQEGEPCERHDLETAPRRREEVSQARGL